MANNLTGRLTGRGQISSYANIPGGEATLRQLRQLGYIIDFLLSALRDADAAKRLLRKALSNPSHPQPRVINTDLAPIYGSAIPDLKKEHFAAVVGTDPYST